LGLQLVEVDAHISTAAASVEPPSLRALDALHLASALALGAELDVLVTYDVRLADAARAAGIEVVAPA
jgi:predicted nucleic acid-binding protein